MSAARSGRARRGRLASNDSEAAVRLCNPYVLARPRTTSGRSKKPKQARAKSAKGSKKSNKSRKTKEKPFGPWPSLPSAVFFRGRVLNCTARHHVPYISNINALCARHVPVPYISNNNAPLWMAVRPCRWGSRRATCRATPLTGCGRVPQPCWPIMSPRLASTSGHDVHLPAPRSCADHHRDDHTQKMARR